MNNRFDDYGLYINRELSWLEFEKRILNEASDRRNLLLERLKFLSITSSNLEEFFMVRVASLKKLTKIGAGMCDIAGYSPATQLSLLVKPVHELMERLYQVYAEELLPDMRSVGIHICMSEADAPEGLVKKADKVFLKEILPRMKKYVVKAGAPFPVVRNRSINIFAKGKEKNEAEDSFFILELPEDVKRTVIFCDGDEYYVFPAENLAVRNLSAIFKNASITDTSVFHLVRNAELDIEMQDKSDLMTTIEHQVEIREFQNAIRLDISEDCDGETADILMKEYDVAPIEVYPLTGPMRLSFLMDLYRDDRLKVFRKASYKPVGGDIFKGEQDAFARIRQGDVCLAHPFDSFDPIVDFIKAAAEDDRVVEIRQTLYRVGTASPVVNALATAAKKGKKVSVLVELKARFDEEHNIVWARMLERAGCNVIFSPIALKIHCKLLMVTRNEDGRHVRYVHLGTGNYNEITAKQYTDISFFTCDPDIGEDVKKIFSMLEGDGTPYELKKLFVSPNGLRQQFINQIERERDNALAGKPAGIKAKLNSLCDKRIIDALYDASCAGVKIQLIVRGICSLRPGMPEAGENITVRSIVGNYLEHSRIFCFENAGSPLYFCSSADWMPRNMDRRVEILFPVESVECQQRLNHLLTGMLKDDVKAWELSEDGTYKKARHCNDVEYSFQDEMCRDAHKGLI